MENNGGQTEIQELKNKNYLELTIYMIMNVCKTIVIVARFDSYYVNWTFSKNIDIVVKLICDFI